MGEFFDMAKKGRVFLFGPGTNEINPIHGADLAKFCVETFDSEEKEVDIGGPEILSYLDIAALALTANDKKIKISSLPLFITRFLVAVAKLFSRHNGEVLAFITTMCTARVVSPNQTGTHHLRDHYAGLAGAPKQLKEA
jgi:uncharacterized protein YbjT (DUF2867 family)